MSVINKSYRIFEFILAAVLVATGASAFAADSRECHRYIEELFEAKVPGSITGVIAGPAAAGKGTAAKKLGKTFSIGEALRAQQRLGTALGIASEPYTRDRILVPDSIMQPILTAGLEGFYRPDRVWLDGLPRKADQLGKTEELLDQVRRAVDVVLVLNIDYETSLQRTLGRLTCEHCQLSYHETNHPPAATGHCDNCGGVLTKRADDTEDKVKKAWEVYHDETLPIIAKFRERKIVIDIDASQTEEDVLAEIRMMLTQDSTRLSRIVRERDILNRRIDEKSGPIAHYVGFAFKPEVTDEQKAEVVADFEALLQKAEREGVRYILDFETGISNSPEGADQGITHNFLIHFPNASYRDYYVGRPFFKEFDPAHDAFKKKVGPLLRVRKAADGKEVVDGVFVTDFPSRKINQARLFYLRSFFRR